MSLSIRAACSAHLLSQYYNNSSSGHCVRWRAASSQWRASRDLLVVTSPCLSLRLQREQSLFTSRHVRVVYPRGPK
jgi:hypothetical protein